MGDIRLGECWTPAQTFRNGIWFAIVWTTVAIARRLPAAALKRVGGAVGILAWVAMRSWRRRAARHLCQAYPEGAPVQTRDIFRGLGEDLADTVRLLNPREPADATLVIGGGVRRVIEEALEEGHGAIWVTAHLGPMERMAALVAAQGYLVATLARESYDPRFDALCERLRAQRGVRTIYRNRPGFERKLLKALRSRYLVGFPMDLVGRQMACTEVEFLGSNRLLPIGPAAIARRAAVPILVGTPEPGPDGKVHVTVERVAFQRTGRGREADQNLTRELARILERRILASPAHWPWMHVRLSEGNALPALPT